MCVYIVSHFMCKYNESRAQHKQKQQFSSRISRIKNPEFPADVIKNWMRLRATIEFLGIWEQINNPDFNVVEFDQFKIESGHNYFVMTPTKWT